MTKNTLSILIAAYICRCFHQFCLSVSIFIEWHKNLHVLLVQNGKSVDYCNISNEMKLQSKMIVREMILNEMKVSFFTILYIYVIADLD